jgi:hypothetical protein
MTNNNIMYKVNTNGMNHTIATGNNGGTFDSTNVYKNKVIYCCGTPNLASGQNLVNTLTSDPLFVNYTGDQTGTYQLSAASPAIGAATSTGAPKHDFAGNPRPSADGLYDIGAYEYMLSGPAPPTGLTAVVQ